MGDCGGESGEVWCLLRRSVGASGAVLQENPGLIRIPGSVGTREVNESENQRNNIPHKVYAAPDVDHLPPNDSGMVDIYLGSRRFPHHFEVQF